MKWRWWPATIRLIVIAGTISHKAAMTFIKKAVICAAALAFMSQASWAHGGSELDADTAWQAWQFTPDIVILTLVVVAIYLAGMWRRKVSLFTAQGARSAAFLSGIALVFLALQSPVDPIAEHLFSVHQIQHMLLKDIGPLLIAWSQPGALLVAGLPRRVRNTVLAPLLSNGGFRGFFVFLASPVAATTLFIASLYVWEVPSIHDAALRNEGLHYLMHVTMLAAGLLFWVTIFDPRPAPKGIRYGIRLMMLWIAILANIVLGAATSIKPMVLYHAYDLDGRLFGVPPIVDEQLGGMVIWIPSSMMYLIALLLVIHAFARHETRMEDARARLPNTADSDTPTTGDELVASARTKNKQFAIGFAGFSLSIFIMAIMISALSLNFGQATSNTARTTPRRPVTRRQAGAARSGDHSGSVLAGHMSVAVP